MEPRPARAHKPRRQGGWSSRPGRTNSFLPASASRARSPRARPANAPAFSAWRKATSRKANGSTIAGLAAIRRTRAGICESSRGISRFSGQNSIATADSPGFVSAKNQTKTKHDYAKRNEMDTTVIWRGGPGRDRFTVYRLPVLQARKHFRQRRAHSVKVPRDRSEERRVGKE